jgi:hypothetical protein
MSTVNEYIRTLIPVNWRSSPSGWTSGNCPMCVVNGEGRPDTKGRGGFRFDDQGFQYNCFNCGYKTGYQQGKRLSYRLKKLMNYFGADEGVIQRLQLQLLQENQVTELLSDTKPKVKNKVTIDWAEQPLPDGSKQLIDYADEFEAALAAVKYLWDRGFDPADERFYYCPAFAPSRMKRRFIIPFTYQGKTVGYTARWIGSPSNNMPKYFNQQPKNNFVYGLDRQVPEKEVVIVTEGIMDAIVTDGVAIGGNECNTEQADIIDNLNKRVILLPDADLAGRKLVNVALERNWEVSFPEWDKCKDAGDAQQKYGRLFTVKSILDNAISNPTKIKVMAQGYCK